MAAIQTREASEFFLCVVGSTNGTGSVGSVDPKDTCKAVPELEKVQTDAFLHISWTTSTVLQF